MLKKASTKETKEVPFMTKEDFLDRFYDGKIGYKLPSKYPENFALCTSYVEGKKEIPLAHRDKVGSILRDAYNALKPIIKKFRLSLGLLIESPVRNKGVAWTKKIKIDFSMPGVSGSREEVVAFTSMVQIKIRNPEFPQNPKKFLNKTSVLAILLHELAHIRHMHHGIRFAMFLKQLYDYAMILGIFPEGEELMLPSSRQWERKMFETKGRMTDEELLHFFETNHNDTDDNEDHHDERVSDYERKEVSVNPEPVPRRRKLFEEDSKRTESKKKIENKKPEKPVTRPKAKRPERLERPQKTERQENQGRVGRTRGGAAAAAAEGKVVMITRKATSVKPRTGASLLDSAKPIKKIITIKLPDIKKVVQKVIEPSKTMEIMHRRASAGENSGVVMVENQGREVVTMANETVEMEVEVNETVGNGENSLGNIVEKECVIDVAVTVNNEEN